MKASESSKVGLFLCCPAFISHWKLYSVVSPGFLVHQATTCLRNDRAPWTIQLIDRSDYVASQRLGGEAMGNNNNGGMAFEDDGFGETLDEDLPIDTDVLEQRLVDEALHRSEETTVEDDQLRQALARSAELARAAEEIDL